MAEKLLEGKPQGTFLIRPNSTGQLALSICCNNMVYHCIIFKTERGYGFAEPYNVYKYVLIYIDLFCIIQNYTIHLKYILLK